MNKKIFQQGYFYNALLVSFLTLLNGCSGAHLDSRVNDQNAKNAKENFANIEQEVNAEFIKQSENLGLLLNEELDAVARLVEGDRDAAAAIIVLSEKPLNEVWLGEEGMVGKRLKKIGVKKEVRDQFGFKVSKDSWTDMSSVFKNDSFQQDAININRQELRAFRYGGPLFCSINKVSSIDIGELKKAVELVKKEHANDETATTKIIEKEIKNRYVEFTQECTKWKATIPKIIGSYFEEGEFIKAWNKRLEAYNDRKEAEKIRQEIQVEFDLAEAEYLKAQTSNEKPSELINVQATRVIGIITAASGIARLSGEEAATEIRLNNINCILAGLIAEDTTPEAIAAHVAEKAVKENACTINSDQQRAALVLAGLPNLADGFFDLAQILNKPPLTALVMSKGELQARLRVIKAKIAREDAKIQLVEIKYQALVDELVTYNTVNQFVKQANINPLSQKYIEYSNPAIKAAVALQIFAQTNSLKKRYQAEYGLIALDYQANKEISEARVAQWYAMLRPLINQQNTYHGSGVKPEQIANLTVEILKAAALFTIAGGI